MRVGPFLTDRLLIREFEEADHADVHAYGSDLEVVRYMPWGPNSEHETRDFLMRVMSQRFTQPRVEFEMAVTLRPGGRVIGGCGLSLWSAANREAMLGYCYHRDVWGRGYATEAAQALLQFGFEDLELHRIFATCDVANLGSARVLEKVGMAREGLLRQNMRVRGGWRDSYLYAILEDDWRALAG